jgi:pimeloyl-ACP methyl ester carboxylesterase
MSPTKSFLARPQWLPNEVWPFETFGLEVRDSIVAVTDVGQGPTLLFVDASIWSFIWRDVIERLSGQFRCVTFDAPGIGRSESLRKAAVTLERTARAVNAVIEKLDLDDITLVTHDLGGPAGVAAAGRTPERIRGLVAVNAFAWKPSDRGLIFMLAMLSNPFVREVDAVTGLLSRLSSTSFGVGRHFDAKSRAAFRHGMNAKARRTFHDLIRDAARCNALYDEIGRALDGPLSRLPLLTIFGDRNDPFGFQKRWKTLFPAARQIVVRNGNHFPMCDAPNLVADEIRSWHADMVAEQGDGGSRSRVMS